MIASGIHDFADRHATHYNQHPHKYTISKHIHGATLLARTLMDESRATLRLVISAFLSLLSSIRRLAPNPLMSASSGSGPLLILSPAAGKPSLLAGPRDALLPLADGHDANIRLSANVDDQTINFTTNAE
jgi:hypothetical protein